MCRTARVISTVFVAVTTLVAAVGCTASSESAVAPTELYQRIQNDQSPVILDVRTVGEYRTGHVPGAVNIPHTELAARLSQLDQVKDREIVVYCEVGSRSRYADRLLRGAGFVQVRRLRGDMAGWRRTGLPVSLN